MRSGGCRKAYLKSIVPYHFHNLIKLTEIIRFLRWLKRCPAKYIQRHNINIGFFQKTHIVSPDFFRPLLWIIIPAIYNFVHLIAKSHIYNPPLHINYYYYITHHTSILQVQLALNCKFLRKMYTTDRYCHTNRCPCLLCRKRRRTYCCCS